MDEARASGGLLLRTLYLFLDLAPLSAMMMMMMMMIRIQGARYLRCVMSRGWVQKRVVVSRFGAISRTWCTIEKKKGKA